MKNNKILVVFPSYRIGGAELYALKLYRNIKEEYDAEITLTSLSRGQLEIDGLNYIPILKILLSFKNYQFTDIHGWLYKGFILSWILKFKFSRAKVFWFFRHAPLIKNNLKKEIDFKIIRYILKGFKPKMIFNSQAAFHANQYHFNSIKENYSICYNWIDEPKVTWNFKKKVKILGVLGRYHPDKGQKELIKIITASNNNQFEWIFCGRDYPSDIMEVLPKNIKTHDYLQRDLFFDQIDILILPSVLESFPNVVYEALIRNIPVISTKVGDLQKHFPSMQFIDLKDRNIMNEIKRISAFYESEKGRLQLNSFRKSIITDFNKKRILTNLIEILCAE